MGGLNRETRLKESLQVAREEIDRMRKRHEAELTTLRVEAERVRPLVEAAMEYDASAAGAHQYQAMHVATLKMQQAARAYAAGAKHG